MAAGVRYGGERKKKPVNVDLVSPTGARITVSEERAKTLLGRAPVDMPEGPARGYVIDEDGSDEDESADKPVQSGRQDRQTARKESEGGDK